MQTYHTLVQADSRNLDLLEAETVDLVITSPPYPMIKMWDELFSNLNPKIKKYLKSERSNQAFELMHEELEKVWKETYRILRPGGIACINIGDATRTIGKHFQLFPNHARVLEQARKIGFQVLPGIIWRKPSNAPNKFMGSGMLPPGAYITHEHEFILLLRKNGKREFRSPEERNKRKQSAYFWEERNQWFSDIWIDLPGTGQTLEKNNSRMRSAAFPFQLAYRLVNMFSTYQDTVLDPFLGTGTTSLASLIAGRNSIGVELDKELLQEAKQRLYEAVTLGNRIVAQRIKNHKEFVKNRSKSGFEFKYTNPYLKVPVMTSQEQMLRFYRPINVKSKDETTIVAKYIEMDSVGEENHSLGKKEK